MSNDDEKDDKLEAAEGDWENLSIPGSKPIEKPTWPEKYTASGRISKSQPELQDLVWDKFKHLEGTISGRFSSSKPNFKEVEPNTAAATIASALSGKGASILIVDDPEGGLEASKLALALKDVDLSDIELRVIGQLSDIDWEKMGEDIRKAGLDFNMAIRSLGQAFEAPTLSASELGILMHKRILENPELFMSKDERRHANHPTEKNPNHPRFQRQPGRPRRNRQRKQK